LPLGSLYHTSRSVPGSCLGPHRDPGSAWCARAGGACNAVHYEAEPRNETRRLVWYNEPSGRVASKASGEGKILGWSHYRYSSLTYHSLNRRWAFSVVWREKSSSDTPRSSANSVAVWTTSAGWLGRLPRNGWGV